MNETDCYESMFSNIEQGLIPGEIFDATVGYFQESF